MLKKEFYFAKGISITCPDRDFDISREAHDRRWLILQGFRVETIGGTRRRDLDQLICVVAIIRRLLPDSCFMLFSFHPPPIIG